MWQQKSCFPASRSFCLASSCTHMLLIPTCQVATKAIRKQSKMRQQFKLTSTRQGHMQGSSKDKDCTLGLPFPAQRHDKQMT